MVALIRPAVRAVRPGVPRILHGLTMNRFSTIRRISNGTSTTSSSQEQMQHFGELADSWWNTAGSQRILHKMNLLRMDFILDTLKEQARLSAFVPGYSMDFFPPDVQEQIRAEQEAERDAKFAQVSGLDLLDVGCGGGILSESLARMKFVRSVTGIDLSSKVLKYAEEHKKKDPILAGKLKYENVEVSQLPEDEIYDIVTMFEVLEHVDYPAEVLSQGLARLKKGGWLFLSTINRTPVSYFTTIFMGECVLGIVPNGTHEYSKYINEAEMREWFAAREEYEVVKSQGCMYVPACGWKMTNSKDVGNYFMAVRKK